jgi:ubiquitin C-terminal hydrolase
VQANKELQEQPIALQQCFDLFTEEERLTGELVCPGCRQADDVMTKRMDFWTMPPIIVVQLKRFYGGPHLAKNGKFVDFPIDGLDLRQYTGNTAIEDTTYDLFAVLVCDTHTHSLSRLGIDWPIHYHHHYYYTTND